MYWPAPVISAVVAFTGYSLPSIQKQLDQSALAYMMYATGPAASSATAGSTPSSPMISARLRIVANALFMVVPPPIIVRDRIYRFCRAAEKPVHLVPPSVSPGRTDPATVNILGRWVWGFSMASISREIALRAMLSASCK